MLFVTLSASALNSCVTPPNIFACRGLDVRRETKFVAGIGNVTTDRANPICDKYIKEPSCGYCTTTISNAEQYVGEAPATWLHKKAWSQIRRESVLIPSEDYATVKAFILNMCKKTNDCAKDIDHWRIKLDSLDSIGSAGGN